MIPQNLITEYNQFYGPMHDFELSQYNKNNLTQCVRGFRVRDKNGKIITSVNQMQNGMIVVPNNNHQFRTPVATKNHLEKKLRQNVLNITANMTFENVYQVVGSQLGPMSDLLHYDIALRIGAAYGIFPKDFIYLHAGALKGALALKKHHYPGLVVSTPKVRLAVFVNTVTELSGFTAYDIEHFLCIYHTFL